MRLSRLLVVPAVVLMTVVAVWAAPPKPKPKPPKGSKKPTDKLAPEVADLLKRIDQLSGKVDYDAGGRFVGLDLSQGQATDADLERLQLLPDLESLTLYGAEIHDSGIQRLTALKKLSELVLENTEITEEGLKAVATLPELQSLNLRRSTYLKDAALAHLTKIPKLQYLSLLYNNFTDEGLGHLAGLSSLKTLSLKFTDATGAGIEKLEKALPGCKISR